MSGGRAGVSREQLTDKLNPLPDLVIRHFGIKPYESVWKAMQNFTLQRQDETPDELWLLQHEPVFTLGQAGSAEHLLSPGNIPLIKADRGGEITYHGPGQLVVYLLIRLARLNLGVRGLVTMIEQSIIDTLASYHIDAFAKPDAPGVYVGDAKIASLGLRIRRGSSFHGLALNIDMDLEPFLRINPCGYAGLRMVQVTDFVASATLAETKAIWLKHFVARAGYQQITEKRGLPEYE